MAAILEDGKLRLSGYVGDYYFEDGFTSGDVVAALARIEADADLAVHINSGGGNAFEGSAIHALLNARKGKTDVIVEGIAASAASLIAMAGDRVIMSAGAVMMIHDPSGFTQGTSADHAKSIEFLEAMATSYARVYADKSGKTPEECREIMKDERWLTPEQAVELGFADDTTEGRTPPVAAFDYRAYAHAPKRLVALAKAKDWRHPDVELPAMSAAQPGPKEKPMDDKTRADALAAELAELKKTTTATAELLAKLQADKADRERQDAIMALPEALGREPTAKALAAMAGITADAAKIVLAASPKVDASDADDEEVGQPDPKAYEARRAAGAGLNGGGKDKPGATASAAKGAERMVNSMKALLASQGKKETA